MPPKCKFSKEQIAEAALELVRQGGMEAVTARGVAERLGASTQVIFGSFRSMESLHASVIEQAEHLHRAYLLQAMQSGEYPPYKASGMGYIRFAREEKELFKLLFMRARSPEEVKRQDGKAENSSILEIICSNTGLDEERAYLLHLELWLFVHGIAVMIATSYLDWDDAFVSSALTDCYMGLKKRFCEEEKDSGGNQNRKSDPAL